jgi:hypothetical protein
LEEGSEEKKKLQSAVKLITTASTDLMELLQPNKNKNEPPMLRFSVSDLAASNEEDLNELSIEELKDVQTAMM